MTATVQTQTAYEIDFPLDKVELIKRTYCQGATDDEFQLFMSAAKRLGLDPVAKQIHAVKRWDSKLNREVMAIQVSIDGFRLQAQRTHEADGQDGPYWCGEDGVWREVWTSLNPPVAAKVVVYRRGQSRPYTGIATYESYCQRKNDGKPIKMWASMPDNQLAKCAEALALRKAFPAELSGIYAPEEMGQADNPEPVRARIENATREFEPPAARAFTAGDAVGLRRDPFAEKLQHRYDDTHGDSSKVPAQPDTDPALYKVPFGKNRGKALSELSERSLAWYSECDHEECRGAAQALMERKIEQQAAAQQAELGGMGTNPDWGMEPSGEQAERINDEDADGLEGHDEMGKPL